MDMWFHGRTLGTMPSHNSYIPIANTILPRPKFASYNSDDQEGKGYRYGQIPANFQNLPSTLKPAPFSPKPPQDDSNEKWAALNYSDPRRRFRKDRRLSKSKRTQSNTYTLPLRWRFSTAVRPFNSIEK